jgi:hypothetical protein
MHIESKSGITKKAEMRAIMKEKKMEERKNVTIIFIVPFCAFLFLFFILSGCSQDISDTTKSTPDSEKQIIAATKVESVFSSLLALEKNPERVKALKIAHKDWLKLRKSYCTALSKDNKKLIECYEALDTQRIETYNNQRISLLYDCPSEGMLPNDKITITYSQEHKINPPVPRSVVVSADAPVAAVTFNNDMTEIFDLVNGRLIHRIKTTWYDKNKTFGNRSFLTPNGRILICCAYMPKTELMMWDVKTGELLRHRTLSLYRPLPTSRGRYFIYSDKDNIGIYDMINEEITWNVEKGEDRISLMAISPDDKYLIVARGHSIENWELVKTTDEKLSLVMRATEPVADSSYYPATIAFANDNKSFYITYSTKPRGSIVQRRLPDLKEMHQVQFPKLECAMLTQTKNTDTLLMEAVFSYSRREAFYVDMVGETAQKIPEHTGANSKMAPLENGRVLLATPYELKTLNLPSKAGFGKFSDIIGEVISQDIPIKTPDKEKDQVIVEPQINCQNFQIEAIGVYEGTLPNNRSRRGGETIAGYVDVHISRTDLPVKLVLSSYEPVIWRLYISSDARLSEICLSGSNDSRVEGIQNILVSYMGNAYAYKDPKVSSSRYSHDRIPSLADVVKQKTGCNITNFQGAYRGSHFYIGYTTKDLSEKNEIYKYIDENGNVIYRNY